MYIRLGITAPDESLPIATTQKPLLDHSSLFNLLEIHRHISVSHFGLHLGNQSENYGSTLAELSE